MKRTISALVTLVIGGVLVALAPAASAQTGYPVAGCSPADTVFDAGTHDIGETFTVRLVPICLWDVGSDVVTTVNGQSVGTKVADAGGGVNVEITVVSATQLSIDDPVIVASRCGENSASGIGPSAAAQTLVRSTAIFRVRCDGVAAAPRAARAGVAFTGANLLGPGAVAVVLLGLGSLLVVGARRRRGTAR
ncbi:MAG: hypothetical protein H0T70_02290 [Acidimicrobiia bacterium]|nr:hypothetical protein [Acidimicrobiia bacterium]